MRSLPQAKPVFAQTLKQTAAYNAQRAQLCQESGCASCADAVPGVAAGNVFEEAPYSGREEAFSKEWENPLPCPGAQVGRYKEESPPRMASAGHHSAQA